MVEIKSFHKVLFKMLAEKFDVAGGKFECSKLLQLYSCVYLIHFSAWGEALFIAIQTTLICGLILEFQRNRLQAIAFLLLYISVTGCIALRLVPMDILYWLQAFNIPIGVSGRVRFNMSIVNIGPCLSNWHLGGAQL